MTEITIKDLRKSVRNNLGGTCTVPRDINYRIRKARKHIKFDPKLLDEIKKQPPELVLSEATSEARELYNLARQVLGDAHRIRMYTRLKVSRKGILYGRISPEHHTEYDAIDFFIDRFPLFIILLESKRGIFYGSKKFGKGVMNGKIKDVLPLFEEKMEDNPLLEELEEFDDSIWREFYNAQNVEARRNIKLFNKNMPKKMQDAYDMEDEKFLAGNNKSLLEFG
jgi:probable DNA metabolism protein